MDPALSRRSLLVLGGGLAGATLAGCASGGPVADAGPPLPDGGYDGPPVELSYWTGFTGGDGPTMRGLVDAFNASQDRITVQMNTVQWGQYYQRVAAAVHAGKGPDVGALQIDQLSTQAARQTLNPLDDVLDDLGVVAEDFPSEVWDNGEFRARATACRSTCTRWRCTPTAGCSRARVSAPCRPAGTSTSRT